MASTILARSNAPRDVPSTVPPTLCQWCTVAGYSARGSSSSSIGVEPAVSVPEAEDGAHAAELPEHDDELPDDGVRAGAEPAGVDYIAVRTRAGSDVST